VIRQKQESIGPSLAIVPRCGDIKSSKLTDFDGTSCCWSYPLGGRLLNGTAWPADVFIRAKAAFCSPFLHTPVQSLGKKDGMPNGQGTHFELAGLQYPTNLKFGSRTSLKGQLFVIPQWSDNPSIMMTSRSQGDTRLFYMQ